MPTLLIFDCATRLCLIGNSAFNHYCSDFGFEPQQMPCINRLSSHKLLPASMSLESGPFACATPSPTFRTHSSLTLSHLPNLLYAGKLLHDMDTAVIFVGGVVYRF